LNLCRIKNIKGVVELVLYGILQFVVLCLFFLLFLWIDWIFKCLKSVKNNNLSKYLTGFLVIGNHNKKNEIKIIGCILGFNLTELIFVNHFKKDYINIATEISNICEFNITNYNESEFIKYVNKYSSDGNGIDKYYIRNMTGLSSSKRIPKILKNKMMCKINISMKEEHYFFYRNTKKNICNINEMQKYIQNKNVRHNFA
jgi:hypothetical protein